MANRTNHGDQNSPAIHTYCGKKMSRGEIKRRKLLLASFVKYGDLEKARNLVGLSKLTVARYMSNEIYRAKIECATEAIELSLLERAYELADGGSEQMVKFLLEAANPSKYDSSVRRQELANQGQLSALGWLTQQMSLEEAQRARLADPFSDTIEVTVIEQIEDKNERDRPPKDDEKNMDAESSEGVL